MNKVVRKEMLAGELPAELAREFDPRDVVSVVVSSVGAAADGADDRDRISRYRHLARATFDNEEDVVRWVRSLRDEWD